MRFLKLSIGFALLSSELASVAYGAIAIPAHTHRIGVRRSSHRRLAGRSKFHTSTADTRYTDTETLGVRDETTSCELGAWQCQGQQLQRCWNSKWNTISTCDGQKTTCVADNSGTAPGCVWISSGTSETGTVAGVGNGAAGGKSDGSSDPGTTNPVAQAGAGTTPSAAADAGVAIGDANLPVTSDPENTTPTQAAGADTPITVANGGGAVNNANSPATSDPANTTPASQAASAETPITVADGGAADNSPVTSDTAIAISPTQAGAADTLTTIADAGGAVSNANSPFTSDPTNTTPITQASGAETPITVAGGSADNPPVTSDPTIATPLTQVGSAGTPTTTADPGVAGGDSPPLTVDPANSTPTTQRGDTETATTAVAGGDTATVATSDTSTETGPSFTDADSTMAPVPTAAGGTKGKTTFTAPHNVMYGYTKTAGFPKAADLLPINRFVMAFWTGAVGATGSAATDSSSLASAWMEKSPGDRKAILQDYHDNGIALLISAFGSAVLPATAGLEPIKTATDLVNWATEAGVDGIDIDFEDSESFTAGTGEEWLISFQTELRKLWPDKLIMHAPQPAYVSGTNYPKKGYVAVHNKVGDGIDAYFVQYYNQMGDKYDTCASIFDSCKGTAVFELPEKSRIPLEKIIVGKPLQKDDINPVNTGFMDMKELGKCVAAGNAKGWNGGVGFWKWHEGAQQDMRDASGEK